MELLQENTMSDKASPSIVIPLGLGNAKRKVLLFFFTNLLCSGMDRTLMKLMDDAELEKAVSLLEGRMGHSSGLARSFQMANKDLMKFSKGKCNILHLGCRNPRHKYGPGIHRIKNTFAERHWWANSWTDIWSFSCSKETNRILVCISKSKASRLRVAIIPLYLTLTRPYLECCVWVGPCHSKTDIYKLERVTKMVRMLEHLPHNQRLRARFIQPADEKGVI